MKKPLPEAPVPKGLYAWNSIHAGSFLLFVAATADYYKFIFLPGPSDYFLTCQDFAKGVESNVLEFVDTLPEDIYQETLSLSCPPKENILTT